METGRRNRLKNRIILMVLSLLLICVLVGCSQESKVITDEQRQEEGIYKIYYTNLEKTALVIHDYKTQSEVFDGRLNEVMTAFQNPDSTNVLSALPEQVKINSTATVINELDVDFNAEYLSLDSITELLLRSALVKTLTQFQGVDSVRFTVDSQSLVIADEEVGPMTSDTFIVPTKDSINSYRNQILTLYFPSEENDTLIQEKRTVYYSTNVNTERLVMEQMLEGPKKKKLLPVTVDGTLVRDISVDNNVCTIDFSEEANSAPPAEKVTDPEVVIYAFVNSIIDSCASDHITGVRFTVEGSSDVRFRNQVNLNQVFSRNADMISTGTSEAAQEPAQKETQESTQEAAQEPAQEAAQEPSQEAA